MDLRQLEVFMEIAASGGFNKAAARLHTAQSALSRRMSQLEHELGVSLLLRSGRGVHLTPAGEVLFERGQGLLRHLQQVREEVVNEASEARGELAIGLPPSLQSVLAVPLLRILREQAPNLFVRAWVATSVLLRDMVLTGKVDLAIIGVLDVEPILTTAPLFQDDMYLVGAMASLTTTDPIDWAQIARLPLILTSPPNSVRQLVELSAARRSRKLNVVMEVNDVPLLLDLVRQGEGYTLLPESAIRHLVQARQVLARPVAGLSYRWVIATSKDRSLSTGGRKAIDHIQERYRVRVPSESSDA